MQNQYKTITGTAGQCADVQNGHHANTYACYSGVCSMLGARHYLTTVLVVV
jgi:hypothetical protein